MFTTGASQTTATVTVTPGDYTGIDFWLDRSDARYLCPCAVLRSVCWGRFESGQQLRIPDLYSESLGCSGLSGGGRSGFLII